MKSHWIDRLTSPVAPRWTLKRQRARVAGELLTRHYEAAGGGRRTQGWRRSSGDANVIIGPALSRLRENARDLVRNNPYAESALATIADHAVGFGIVGKPTSLDKRTQDAWNAWADSTACDADGRHDFYGLQKLVMRTVVQDGEVLIRRRVRRIEDRLPLPMQLQVLEADFLDTLKDTSSLPTGQPRIIQGVEYDGIGRRVAYWIFPEHPGSNMGAVTSVRVPAESVLHVFKPTRPGQVRAPSWFAQVLVRFKDFDEFEDATLMKQKIAACLAVITSDIDGSAAPLGTTDTTEDPQVDSLEPGMIINVQPGRTVEVVQPPQVREYDAYATTVLRAIATGLGVTYEDLTGDYKEMPFSAARMSRLRHEARVHDWRWRILIPQFCDPVWAWAMQIAAITGQARGGTTAKWTPPPLPMVDPANEGLAVQRNIRTGIVTLSESIRERGYDPDELLNEMAEDNKKLDKLGIILDSDPRKMSQAGQMQASQTTAERAPDAAAADRAALQTAREAVKPPPRKKPSTRPRGRH
jgi:lambda family phage portal protein